jgi:uncharacterized alkaline shock family protein YloU
VTTEPVHLPDEGLDAPTSEHPFVVRVAPAVLAAIVRRAVERVRGVARLAEGPRARPFREGTAYMRDGVRLAVTNGSVRVAVHLVIARGYNLHEVGSSVQAAVGQSLEQMVGMRVENVDVYVQDVE